VKGQIDFWTEHNPFEDFEAPYFPKSVCEAKISTKKSLGNKNNKTRDLSHLAVKNTSWPQTCHPGESNTRPVYVMLGILDNLTSWIERKKPEQNLDFLNLNEKKIKCVSSSSSDQKSMNFEQFT